MKHFFKPALLAAFLFCTFIAFARSEKKSKESFKEFKSTYGGVVFSVDPRIELYHAVVLGIGLPMISPVDIDYKQTVAKEMAKYKSHPLFTFAERNLKHGKVFNAIDAPIWFLLHLTNDFEWRKELAYPDQSNVYIDSFRYHLKKFVEETDYVNFFNSNADLYNISIQTLKFNLKDFQEKERVLNYYGVKNKEGIQFNLILNFFGKGNFGPRLQTKKGREMYAVMSPEKSFVRLPTFDQVNLYNLVWHEFGHSFANPAVEKQPYLSQIEALSYLHAPIKESMRAQAYDEWQSVVKEHLTSAVACRLAAQKFGEEYAELNFVRPGKGKRWIYFNPLLAALKEYEKNRAEYPMLEDFMPQIVSALKNVTQSDIDKWMAQTEEIRKPDVERIPLVSDIVSKDSVLVVLSSSEEEGGEKLDMFIKDFIKNIHAWKNATIVTDKVAEGMDLSRYNLYVVGTPKGNSLVAKLLPHLPVRLTEKGVLGEKMYEGKGYALLAGWVNPYNTAKVMTVMAALHPADLINFNWTEWGGTNYHIIKDLIIYKRGDFVRNGLVWMCE
jgi:hypothetical protein